MSDNPTATGKPKRARKAKAPTPASQAPAWRRWIIPIIVLIALVAAAIAWLVHANNVQSKATHEEFAAAQKAYAKADTSYKEAAQKLKNESGSCAKSYDAYDVCPALASAHKDVEGAYGEITKKIEAIDPKAVDKMPEATETLKNETSRLQELERQAGKAVEDYSTALLKAVRDEHSTAMNDARTQLKEAKALLSNSEGRTSDSELWEAVKKMLSVHEKVLAEQEKVSDSDPDAIIEATKTVRMEAAAIESEMSHLKAIYDPKATPSATKSESADAQDGQGKAKPGEDGDQATQSASVEPSEAASAEASEGASPSPSASADEEALAEDPDA